MDPYAAEWREEERQIGSGLGDAAGSVEQEKGGCEPETVKFKKSPPQEGVRRLMHAIRRWWRG